MQPPTPARAVDPAHTQPPRQQQAQQPQQQPQAQQQFPAAWQHIRRLLKERLDGRVVEAFRAQAHGQLAAQRAHDAAVLLRAITRVWTDPKVPRCVAINDALSVCFDAPGVLVAAAVDLAQRVPPAITLTFDETDTLVVPARDLYFAQGVRRLLPRMREAVAAEDTDAMASLQESIESAIALPHLTTRHRILLADDVTEIECRGRLPLL
nr:hypothetical protein [Pandoravirus massiliensis]